MNAHRFNIDKWQVVKTYQLVKANKGVAGINKQSIEPELINDSYGYRPKKSAIDAVRMTRKRCWYQGRILEFDIKGCLTISHMNC